MYWRVLHKNPRAQYFGWNSYKTSSSGFAFVFRKKIKICFFQCCKCLGSIASTFALDILNRITNSSIMKTKITQLKSLKNNSLIKINIMKTRVFFIVLLSMLAQAGFAQSTKLVVLGFDVQVEALKNQNLTELLRIELAKHQNYEITDRYEVAEVLKANDISATSCQSKSCLIKAGNLLKVDKVVSGSVDQMGESIYIRIRIMDVKKETVDKEVVKQFLYLPEKINPMMTIAINQLRGVANDKTLEESLSSTQSYESAVNNPHYAVLSLAGPRMGYTFLTGDAAAIFKSPKSEGGYDGYPALFQFGYQFEKQYLNEGKIQALFEFIPMISGLDQGLFIPSITIMNGLRNNANGVEFAIGPSFNIVKQSKQFQDANGVWHRVWDAENTGGADEVMRMDSRGQLTLKSYVVLAAGFSIRSGKMNIPINAFVIPAKESLRFGFSFGFNARG
jgi:hypothetical protein